MKIELKEDQDEIPNHAKPFHGDNDALDAARYRWMRENNWFTSGIVEVADWGRTAHETFERLDEVVDKAMRGSKVVE